MAKRKPKEVEDMNKEPRSRRVFVEFEVGDRFYLSQIPTATYQHYSDPRRHKLPITAKMQFKHIGPYTITKKFSPVLYEAKVNGELKTVHALQMKPDPTSKYYTQHISTKQPSEERRRPEPNHRFLPSGKPYIPLRLHKRLRSTTSKLPTETTNQDELSQPRKINQAEETDESDGDTTEEVKQGPPKEDTSDRSSSEDEA